MNDYTPSLTSGESACDINLPDAPPARREKIKGSPVKRWLKQPSIEDPWSRLTSRRRQILKVSNAMVKPADYYKVGDPPKSYILRPIPFPGLLPSFPYASSVGKGQEGAAADASRTRAANGFSESPREGLSREDNVLLKSTEQAKMNDIQMKGTSISDNQLLVFSARRLNEISEMSTNVRLRVAVLCCNSDMLDIGTFGSNFITIARERKVENFSTLLPELLIPLARAWNKPRIFIGLSAKQGRRSQHFMVLLRTFTLLTHQLRPEWDTKWHIYQLYRSVSKLTCHTGGGTNSSTGASETPTRLLDGASRGFMSTPGKRKACDPSGSANNGKRVKISAADLPEAQNSRRLACPFSKHNPARYRNVHSACTVPPGFLDIKSFMEHLKRCHAPLRCQVCKIKFVGSATDALRARDAHRASNVCTLQTELSHEPEWMTEHQERVFTLELVKRILRKPRVDPVVKWNCVYRYLFDIPNSMEIPNPFYDYYIPRYELDGWEISGVQSEPSSSNTEPPSVIEEDSAAFEPSASSSSQEIQQQPSLTNNDTWVSSTARRTPAASSLLASPEAHHIDGEQSDSGIASLNHQIAPSRQVGSSTGANLGEMEPLPEMYSRLQKIISRREKRQSRQSRQSITTTHPFW